MPLINNKINPIRQVGKFRLSPIAKWVKFAAITSVTSSFAFSATAQEAQTENLDKVDNDIEVVQVVGTRRTIQDQIAIKREATTVVDGLSASDIGDLPALSIGEALETITGASSHRENGGATEISIRGLGPFLSATHINGREATNGSGDRSVNFSQFPSELMKKVAIYKTQDASMIEGGVAGVITLETLKPLDFGKQRFQAEAKLNYNPDQADVENSLQGDLGYRGTLSYVDQFEFDNGSALGVTVGWQRQDISQPEAEYRSSSPSGSSLWACLNDPTNTNEGFFRSSAGDCEDQVSGLNNQGYETDIAEGTDEGTPYAWTGSSRSFRQNETSDEREALFIGLQYQPSENWDINFDAQISDRNQAEARHDLQFEQKNVTPGITGQNLITNSVGGILHWEGFDRIQSAGEQFSREENYRGYGLNVEHNVSDELTISADIAYSQTKREELQISNRGRASSDTFFTWDLGEHIPNFTVTDFDVTDISNFASQLRTRLDRENVRENEVISARVDFDYAINGDTFSSIQGGIRVSELSFVQFGGTNGNGSRNDSERTYNIDVPVADSIDVLEACQIDFPESDFLSRVSDGDLITNVDSSGNVIASGTGSSWATYDNVCFSKAVLAYGGEEFAYPDVVYEDQGTIDVTEKTTSAYIMANYDTEMMGKFIRGNFGVRVVNTEVTSIGFRQGYVFSQDPLTDLWSSAPAGDIQRTEAGSDYTEVLPSFNLVVDYSEDILLRAGVYRGMSRADPSDLGFNRTIDIDETGDATAREDLLNGVTGSGNPSTKPLMSWNYDVAVEWYPNDDSILALGFYYKQFNGGFQQQTVLENFTIDGVDVALPITNSVTTDESSDLYGLEASFSYRWDNGVGVKLGYNYADTDYEFEDSLYGNTFETGLDGVTTQLTEGIVEAGGVPGFSEHVFSGQVYYQVGDFDTALIYKYRSEYFQPYTSNGTRLRYVDEAGVWEARASYKINKQVRIKISAINLFSEPKSQDFFTIGNTGEVNDYGPRLFAGISFKY